MNNRETKPLWSAMEQMLMNNRETKPLCSSLPPPAVQQTAATGIGGWFLLVAVLCLIFFTAVFCSRLRVFSTINGQRGVGKWSGKRRRANTALQRHTELQRVVEEKAIAERARQAIEDKAAVVERANKVVEHEREANKVAEDHDKLCVVCMEKPKHVVLIPCMQHCSSPVICFD